MRLGLVLLIALLLPASVLAEPTPVNRFVDWSHTGGADGFYLYWAPESETPRVYSNVRRAQIADGAARALVVLDVNPQATERLCFVLTAYKATTESAFSNEACGFFGIPGPFGVGVR